MDLVSIITPLYNAEAWIEETADSIFQQTYTNWEWIIINDYSKDSSYSKVQKLAENDWRIKLLNNDQNLKTALTRNRGIREAKGKYIAFIDADDIWHPLKLEKQISFMKETGAELSYHAYRKFRGTIDNLGSIVHVPETVNYRELLKSNVIACLSAVFDAESLGKVEMPDGFKAREDYLCWLKILKTTEKAYGMSDCLGYYRVHHTSYSSNKFEVAGLQWSLYRNHERLNIFQSAVNFSFYLFNGYLKSKII